MRTIKAALPSVLYRRPSPNTDPYITEGAPIAPGQTIALIEVMKAFNEVKVDKPGTLTRFLIEDGDEVSIGDEIVEVE